MQAVNIQQLIPQQQTQTKTDSPPLKTGDTSFMDMLRSEGNAADQNKKISQTETSDKNSSADKSPTAEKHQEQTSSAEKNGAGKNTAEKISSEKESAAKESVEKLTAKKSKTAKSESEEKKPCQTETDASGKAALAQNSGLLKTASAVKNVKQDGAEKTVSCAAQKNKTEDAQLAWLAGQTNEKTTDKISSDDFASLIDAATEFIPGSETEADKLARSQNLAVTDPAQFLANAVQQLTKNDKDAKTVSDGKDDSAKKDKTKTTVRFEVRDERTVSADMLNQKNDIKKVQAKSELVLSPGSKEGNNASLTMDLVNHAQQNITASSGQTAAAAGSDFQSMLSNAIQQNAPEFVKAGSIVLKDNNQGTINLILHPESLGNVKISLSLSDKVIAGQITVQSQEAYNAFKESIDSIKQAFAQNGFETAGFNLNFAGNSNFAGNGQGGQQQQMDSSYRAGRTYGDYASAGSSSERNEAAYDNQNFYAVDIVA
jgi:flagellar protein FlbC